MVFTETTSQSWFGRLGGAFKGILFGGILFLIAFPLQFWNEGRAVRRIKTLAEGRGAVIADVATDNVDGANDGKLVHMIGRATTKGSLADSKFSVVADNALKLKRRVEMYQWHEDVDEKTRKKTGGGKETTKTYSYYQDWSEEPIDSSRFHRQNEVGSGNPSMPFQTEIQTAEKIDVGAFYLNESLVKKINNFEPMDVSDRIENLSDELKSKAHPHNGGFYIGANSGEPKIGDLRINYLVIKPTGVSLISEQTGSSFRPYTAKTVSGSIERLEIGNHSVDEMFKHMEDENTFLTWMLRMAGLGLMAVGLGLVLRPLAVISDVIPFFGSIVGAGTWLIALLLAGFFSFATISIAWIFYRPIIGTILLVVSLVFAYLVYSRMSAASKIKTDTKDGIPVVG